MSQTREHFDTVCGLIEAGETMAVIERFYAQGVTVFENRRRARAGRDACLRHERDLLASQPQPPSFRIVRRAFDEPSQTGFLELVIRFISPEGRPMLLEEVAVQRWAGGEIDSERFYYEGFVDEGDD